MSASAADTPSKFVSAFTAHSSERSRKPGCIVT
jgi:hypothetical protein